MMRGVTADFDYSNISERPRGPFLSVLARVLPGVRTVQEQVEPYAVAWQRANRAALAGTGPVWVAIGDSMTQGIGATAFDRGWVGQLSTQLTGQGWEHRVVNLGVNGARVEDVLASQLPVLEDLLDRGTPVGLVTVVIGANDIVLRRHRAGLIERFVQLLDRLPPRAVVANLANPRREARAIDDLLRARDAAGDLVLADMRRHGPPTWRGRLASDTFHPNDAGYTDMAAVFAAAMACGGLPDLTDPGESVVSDPA